MNILKTTKRERNIIERTYEREMDFDSYDDRVFCAYAVSRLMRIQKKLHRIYEDECNTFIEDEVRIKKRSDTATRLENEARSIAKENGFEIRINSDPRGEAIKLNLNPKKALGGSDSVEYTGMDTDLLC